MTIEERYGCIGCKLASCEGCDSFLLVKGATEQEVITKQEMIEKAKEWVKEFCTETNYAKDEIPIIVKSIELFMKE